MQWFFCFFFCEKPSVCFSLNSHQVYTVDGTKTQLFICLFAVHPGALVCEMTMMHIHTFADTDCFVCIIIIIIINPLTARSLGHYRWFCDQFSPFSPVLHCPLGLAKLQACPFPDVVFPPLPLSALSSSPFHCALQDGFGQTWWTGNMTIPLHFVSLYDHQERDPKHTRD